MNVAGVDCSTQSTKVIVCDAETGAVVRQGRAPHPDSTEVHPDVWWDAFVAAAEGMLDDVAAIGVSGQQHGLVTLDEAGAVVRPALLWNDVRSAAAAQDLVAELGGPRAWAEAVGSVPVASFTVAKLRWLAEHEPRAAARVARVLLPHDWLTWRMLGGSDAPDAPVTDRGDASGTGYWAPATAQYRTDLVKLAFGGTPELPRVAGPAEPAGQTPAGRVVSAGTGDNMALALGLGAGPADVVVSLGTSGTVFAVHTRPTADATGAVAGFADATGRFLPLVCTLNAARVLTAAAQLLRVDLAELDDLALSAAPGAGGLVLLPYLDGERTPNLPDASGTLLGLRRDSMTPANLARAAVEGMLCGLADGLDALRAQGVEVRRALLVGGAAQSRAVRAVAAQILDTVVEVPEPAEYAARGAAAQAAWALSGQPDAPPWTLAMLPSGRSDTGAGSASFIRERYAEMRDTVHR